MDPAETHALLDRAGLSPPETLTIALTPACNLACVHCWVEAEDSRARGAVPAAIIRGILRDFVALGGCAVRLTGGEPLLHPDWRELLRYVVELGLGRLILQTNGILFKPADLLFLRNLDISQVQIQISLDGATAAAHDLVRGKGAYALTLKGLERLAAAGLASKVALFFTEMRHNLHELPDLFRLAERLGVGAVSSGCLVSCGRAGKNAPVSPPEPEQYLPLLRHFAEDSRFQQLYARLGQVAALDWSHCDADQPGCSFVKNPYLTATGILYPCLMCHAPDYAVTEVFAKGLHAAVREGVPRWSELQLLSRTRATSLSECQDCALRQSCAGGCMGRAWGSFGAFLVAEDRCGQRRLVLSGQKKS